MSLDLSVLCQFNEEVSVAPLGHKSDLNLSFLLIKRSGKAISKQIISYI